jgi:hypothetical protein
MFEKRADFVNSILHLMVTGSGRVNIFLNFFHLMFTNDRKQAHFPSPRHQAGERSPPRPSRSMARALTAPSEERT